ncbi:hypothetical protein JA1_001435 [Spathaspora sp. JA1]|nr:hypothetical protein JA1_001435 [Spathaspora sp. JA1]
MKSIVVFNLFLLGIFALDISSPTTSTSAVISGDSVIIEPTGLLVLVNAIQFVISSLTVRNLAKLFFIIDGESLVINTPPTVDIQSLDNNGYVLFDVSRIPTVNLPFRTSNKNNGELIFYGVILDVEITEIENTGSMTFWGGSGNLIIRDSINTGDICFYKQEVQYISPGGAGCFHLASSYVRVETPKSDFTPTVVFGSEGYSEFRIQSTPQVLNFKLINFGVTHQVTLPNSGFPSSYSFNYDPSNGWLFFHIAGYDITLDIGTGYDVRRFRVTADLHVYITYLDPPPAGANQGGCPCNLNTQSSEVTTEIATSTSEVEETTLIETSTDIETTSEVETTLVEPSVETSSESGTTLVEPSVETTSTEIETSSDVAISSSSITPQPSHCRNQSGPWNKGCDDDHHNGNQHGGNHNNGHGFGHGGNNDNWYGNGHGNDHDDHRNNNGNNHNNHGNGIKGHGNDHDNHRNGNNNNGHKNDHDIHDNKKGNENNRINGGNGNFNQHGNGNNKDNGKGNRNNGRGHKRDLVVDNSAWSNSINPISIFIIIGVIGLAIV